MDKRLYNIIKEIYSKYGKEHHLTIASVRTISPFLKTAEDIMEVQEVLGQGLDVNIDEIISLFKPESFDFEASEIGNIKVRINE